MNRSLITFMLPYARCKTLVSGDLERPGVQCHSLPLRRSSDSRGRGGRSWGAAGKCGAPVQGCARLWISPRQQAEGLKPARDPPVMSGTAGLLLAEGVTICSMSTKREYLMCWETTGSKMGKSPCFHKPCIPLARERENTNVKK